MNNIRNMRMKKDISIGELHRRSGIPIRTIEDWEHDKRIPTVYHRLKTIAEILECSIDDLMVRTENAILDNQDVNVELESVESGTSLRIYNDTGELVINELITNECGIDLVNYLKKQKDISDFMNTNIMFVE